MDVYLHNNEYWNKFRFWIYLASQIEKVNNIVKTDYHHGHVLKLFIIYTNNKPSYLLKLQLSHKNVSSEGELLRPISTVPIFMIYEFKCKSALCIL